MIPRIQRLRNTVYPNLRRPRSVLQATTNNAPAIIWPNPRSRVRIRSREQHPCNERRYMCSKKEEAPTAAVAKDWNLLYPSPSAIDVTPLAESLRSKVRDFTRERDCLKLIGLLANDGSHRIDSEIYSDRIQQTFQEDGIDYEVWKYPEGGGYPHNENDHLVPDEDKGKEQKRMRWIKDRIKEINGRNDVDGALIFYPIHPLGAKGPYKCRLTGVYYKTQDDHIRDLLHPSKDVEGLCGTKWFQIRDSKQKDPPAIYPCTALSVLRILEKYHIGSGKINTEASGGDFVRDEKIDGGISQEKQDTVKAVENSRCWKDQTISIVNRSEIMGRPLAVMLAQRGATVYSIDIDSILEFRPHGRRLRRCNPETTTLETCLEESTVVVTGVPDAGFRLPLSSIETGTTIVSVSEFPNVCEETLFGKRPDIQYIPQVGKVTVATLSMNLMNLKRNRTRFP